MRVLLMGPPGVGKGTQAALMSSYLDVPAIATGNMLRAAVESGSTLGQAAQEIMAKGELVPDALMIDLIADRLSQDDAQKGFILDGFPRTVAQAKALSDLLRDLNIVLDAVFFLDADEPQVVERLGGLIIPSKTRLQNLVCVILMVLL
jgi:adenylate kinase